MGPPRVIGRGIHRGEQPTKYPDSGLAQVKISGFQALCCDSMIGSARKLSVLIREGGTFRLILSDFFS
jgi:hypothetical protein